MKVVTGCVHAWILLRISSEADTAIFHKEGLLEYHLLFTHPGEYFTNMFQSGYSTGYAGMFSSTNSYWNDLTSNLIIKFLSICDIFTFGYYYVNVIFYNAAIFFGAIGLHRVFNTVYPGRQYLLVVTCFLLPSLLFFSSTIHKDGIILATIGIAVFNIYQAIHISGFTLKRVLYIFLALILMFLQRNYVSLAFLPAAFAWIVCVVKKYPALKTFIIIYIAGAILFFSAGLLAPALNLPEKVTNKQWAFNHLPAAATYIKVDSLPPNFRGFLLNSPQALNHVLLRPAFSDIHLSGSLIPLAIELFCYQLLVLLFIFYRNKTIDKDPFIFFGYFFGFSVLLIIGYTIPVIGAIVRYRSTFLPFILTPLICAVDWVKIKSSFQIFK
ncbi:hypothetical protein QWZ08_08470 [Ferruginibacter paludis]|uniref:hypothetical protein n=1 Tax=Ferruginibacter paludis TaxID=1310417 RepID=UPI0025B60DAB|nr:hypothetical protein [Ferruginibacter paludis]MDN3655656.1 hypothetical protein [Ferruginibacter paludis]